MTEDEMIGWHHQLRHEFQQALGAGDGEGSLSYTAVHEVGRKEVDMTE